MSAHRDLQNAQAALNEAVRAWYVQHRWLAVDHRREATTLALAWQDYADECLKLDGKGTASARQTSILAGVTTLPNKGSVRRKVIAIVVAHHAHYRTGLATFELEARLHKSHQTVSSAVNFAEQHGWIKDSGLRRKTQFGKDAIVYEPTAMAVDALRDVVLAVES